MKEDLSHPQPDDILDFSALDDKQRAELFSSLRSLVDHEGWKSLRAILQQIRLNRLNTELLDSPQELVDLYKLEGKKGELRAMGMLLRLPDMVLKQLEASVDKLEKPRDNDGGESPSNVSVPLPDERPRE